MNSAGTLTTNLYDHLVVFEPSATGELIEPATILDLRALASDHRTFFQTMSDHLPLMARFRVMQDDD